jgi:hypothetical protein
MSEEFGSTKHLMAGAEALKLNEWLEEEGVSDTVSSIVIVVETEDQTIFVQRNVSKSEALGMLARAQDLTLHPNDD